MKAFVFALMAISAFCINIDNAYAGPQDGLPIEFVGGCEIDLDANGNPDSALMIHTTKGYELVVILKSNGNTRSFLVTNSKSKMFLTCHYGKQVKETDAGPGKKRGKTYQTNGTYLKLSQPESSSAAYFWSEGKFKEIWLSD